MCAGPANKCWRLCVFVTVHWTWISKQSERRHVRSRTGLDGSWNEIRSTANVRVIQYADGVVIWRKVSQKLNIVTLATNVSKALDWLAHPESGMEKVTFKMGSETWELFTDDYAVQMEEWLCQRKVLKRCNGIVSYEFLWLHRICDFI